jgi:CHASE2 domain-containing sensor protein/tRNA A-37 threonylcarbamoyl transferase component Bud32
VQTDRAIQKAFLLRQNMAKDPSTPPNDPSTPPTEALPDTQSSPISENSPAARTTRPSPNHPTRPEPLRSSLSFKQIGHLLTGVWAIVAATVTVANLPSVQSLEREAQSLLVRVRGPIAPPSEVIILAIDEESLSQLSNWPLRRAVYAQTIEKVMKAGAKAVGVDVIWDLPSSYGSTDQTQLGCVPGEQREISEDDGQLEAVLKRYDGRISLAAKFNNQDVRQGEQSNLSLPYCPFRTERSAIGTTNFLIEPNNRLHRLGNQFLATLPAQEAEIIRDAKLSSFAEATLQASRTRYPQPQGENIFFYGAAGTFTPIPFWYVLSPENWASDVLKKGQVFKDKIVLIGPTTLDLDFHNTPFAEMSGVEIHANAIATLLENRSIRKAFPDPLAAGGVVFLTVLGAAFVLTRTRNPIARLFAAGAIAFGWGSLSYVAFTNSLVIVPTAIPMGAIVAVGMSYLGIGVVGDRLNSQRTRQALMRRSRSPMIQEIIEQQDDLKDLLRERELEIANKTLKNRYKIDKVLASGGFGETYIAKDLQRPQDPECVVKHLHPVSNHPSHLRLASKMFAREAEILERLGKKHDQIPRLLAYFEEDQEFYLVQEFIAGNPLSEEFLLGRQLPEARVVHVLKEILQILHFVHEEKVIHRDVKPSNIIKRQADGKLVLIDFGAVKDQYNKLANEETQTNLTVGIGTQGYMAPEQGAGKPQPSSDVYAVGMMGIQALTGLPPSQLKEDPDSKEVAWQEKAQVSSGLANILAKMVRYDFRDRYQSAIEAVQDLKKLCNSSTIGGTIVDLPTHLNEDDISTMTRPWPETFGSEELPRTEPPPQEK